MAKNQDNYLRFDFNFAFVQEMALTMIHTIREAFNELLAENHWMDDETRAVAKEKADAMNERIGYPQLVTDPEELNKEYDGVSIETNLQWYLQYVICLFQLNITRDRFMINVLNVLKFEAEKDLKKLRQPVDKDKWSTEPAVANAFYSPNKNDIGNYTVTNKLIEE